MNLQSKTSLQISEIAYALEQTQDHLAQLPLTSPAAIEDKRHTQSASFPFMEYDILSDDEEPSNGMFESKYVFFMLMMF